MARVLVTPVVLYHETGPWRDILEKAGLQVVFPPHKGEINSPEELLERLDGIDAVLAGMEPFTRQVLQACKVRVIARMGVGYDAINVPAATEVKAPVTITPGANEISVAEHTLALLLGVFRGFPMRDHYVRRGPWKRVRLPRLGGKTIGLVGFGRIGKAVAPRAIGLGLKVIACDPCAKAEDLEKLGVRLVDWETLLAEADIVSLHAPNTPQTANLINAQSLAKMKKGAVLINTARGSLVDEAALFDALASGQLMAAGLDVFKTEPFPLDSPLLTLDNVLLTPHMAGLDDDSEEAMSRTAAWCIAELYQGRWPAGYVVNDALKDGWKW